jgi:hypothetical protein
VIKAIETQYKGYRFRSRLEARWAVFFDALGVRWEYEPEGFDMDGVRYLPDFRVWTPQGEPMWYEIKPGHILSDPKFDRFSLAVQDGEQMQARVALLSGDPHEHLARKWRGTYGGELSNDFCPRCTFIGPAAYSVSEYKEDYMFGCMPCDAETPGGGENDLEPGFAGTMVRPHKGSLIVEWYAYDRVRWLVESAADAARASRFEHGEARAL